MAHEHFLAAGMGDFPWLFFVVMMVICLFFFFRRGARSSWCCWSDRRNQGESAEPESALEILKKRYARGEITPEEFERIKKNILT